jgi:hypothetical protein
MTGPRTATGWALYSGGILAEGSKNAGVLGGQSAQGSQPLHLPKLLSWVALGQQGGRGV